MSSPYKTVALHTFGCKANFADTSLLNSTFDKKAILYILNAEDDSESSICKIIKKHYKLKNTILVSSKDKTLIESINKLLWTFEQLSLPVLWSTPTDAQKPGAMIG